MENSITKNTGKILIVDDEPAVRSTIELLLRSEGHQIFLACNGVEGLMLAEQELPDLLLLDVMMPEMDGYEVCRRLRETPGLAEMPVIMVTALDDMASRIKGLDAGADDFVSKPVNRAELKARVRTIMRLNRYRRLMEQQEKLAFLLNYDSLTNLPNRNLLKERMTQSLEHTRRHDGSLLIVTCSIQGLHQANHILGHDGGDLMLQALSQRIVESLRTEDMVARVGGNQLALMEVSEHPEHDALSIVNRLRSALKAPVDLGGHHFFASLKIGIAVFPGDGDDPDSLINCSELARRQAEASDQDYAFYSDDMNRNAKQRILMEAGLRFALEQNQFRLYYQPKVELNSGRVIGVEALIRWIHPESGVTLPNQFIHLAEETGLIRPIGEWVLREACNQLVRWQQNGLGNLSVAVNLASPQFNDPELVQKIAGILQETGAEAGLLELELTEGQLTGADQSRVITVLNNLKALGLQLSIDDFGTGYSSLSRLQQFPVDVLKIDRAFIKDLPDNLDSSILSRAIIFMSHGLGKAVVAEGVETEDQSIFLGQLGCEMAQGYLYSRPLPVEELEIFLAKQAVPSK